MHHRPLLWLCKGRWLFEDKLNKALRIQSPVPSPWGQQWAIVPSMQYQKADKSKWPYRLVLKLFPVDGEGVPVEMEREEVKGHFAWADYQPLAFYAFPTPQSNIWLIYSFYKT